VTHVRVRTAVAWTAFAATGALIGWLARGTRGTSDVSDVWLHLISQLTTLGPIHGYAATAADYPPGSYAILWMVGTLAHGTGVVPLTVLKITTCVFLLATALLVAIASQRPWLGTATLGALALSAPALMYLDIFVAPFIVIAIWAAIRGRTALMLALVTSACLMKWQPLFVLPFAALYLAGQRDAMPVGEWRRLTWRSLGLCAAIAAIALAVYGWPVVLAFYAAGRHGHFSNFAMNLPWALGWWLERTSPARYGHLTPDGFATIANASRRELRIMAGVSLLAYGLVCRAYWKHADRSVAAWLRYALVGYLAYFTLCSGVHENHLFLANLLGLGLAWVEPRRWWVAAVVAVAANLNLYAFYGLTGAGPVHLMLAGLDWTVWLSVANCAAFAGVALALL